MHEVRDTLHVTLQLIVDTKWKNYFGMIVYWTSSGPTGKCIIMVE